MPYIKKDLRKELDPEIMNAYNTIKDIAETSDQIDGMLNYVITVLLRKLYGDRNCTSYTEINAAMGVLKCASDEYYRTVAAPYEEQKKFENGDIE